MSETNFKFSKFSWYSHWVDVGHFNSNFNAYLIQVRVSRRGKKQYRNEKVNKGSTYLTVAEIKEINHG